MTFLNSNVSLFYIFTSHTGAALTNSASLRANTPNKDDLVFMGITALGDIKRILKHAHKLDKEEISVKYNNFEVIDDNDTEDIIEVQDSTATDTSNTIEGWLKDGKKEGVIGVYIDQGLVKEEEKRGPDVNSVNQDDVVERAGKAANIPVNIDNPRDSISGQVDNIPSQVDKITGNVESITEKVDNIYDRDNSPSMCQDSNEDMEDDGGIDTNGDME